MTHADLTDRERPCIYGPPPCSFRETLGILVLDGSGSMGEMTAQRISKAETVHMAVKDLFSRVKASNQRDCFYFAIVNYDHRSIVRMKPTAAKDIDENSGDYNPMEGLGGATYISEGLKDAKKTAKAFLNGGSNRHVVVMLMTDGVDMTQPETVSLSNALKQLENVKLTGCFFETVGADTAEMKRCADYIQSLCSSPDDFKMVDDAGTLYEFFVDSMRIAYNVVITTDMQDKSLFNSSQPRTISEGLQNFIDSMVEEIVLEGKPFDKQKKYLKKYCENEGVDYDNLEADITTFLEILDSFKTAYSELQVKLAKEKGLDCYLSESTIEKLVEHSVPDDHPLSKPPNKDIWPWLIGIGVWVVIVVIAVICAI